MVGLDVDGVMVVVEEAIAESHATIDQLNSTRANSARC